MTQFHAAAPAAAGILRTTVLTRSSRRLVRDLALVDVNLDAQSTSLLCIKEQVLCLVQMYPSAKHLK